jgi:hypothetical protein
MSRLPPGRRIQRFEARRPHRRERHPGHQGRQLPAVEEREQGEHRVGLCGVAAVDRARHLRDPVRENVRLGPPGERLGLAPGLVEAAQAQERPHQAPLRACLVGRGLQRLAVELDGFGVQAEHGVESGELAPRRGS